MNTLSVMKSSVAISLVAVSLLAVAAGSAWAQDSEPKTLVAGRLKANLNMHPMLQVNNTKKNDMAYAIWPITVLDGTGKNMCALCEVLPTIDNGMAKVVEREDGTKGLEVTIRLKEGLRWGDGEPVTSDDIVFTWEMARDPNIGFTNFNPWSRADEVEVVDDRTVIMHLPELDQGYASWDQIIPEHLERPVYEEYPNAEEYSKNSTYNSDTTNPGLWNGPFTIAEWNPGTRVTFERNEYFPGPGPEIDRVVFTYRDNNAALQQSLLAGALDYVLVSKGGISLPQMLEVRKQYPDRFNYLIDPGITVERIAFNLENPILSDVNVRRAIAYGFNRQQVNDILYDGVTSVAHGPLPPISPYYDEEAVRKYEFDPERARELLAESGWTPGGDGICVKDEGERLELELVVPAQDRTREQIAQVMQSQLEDICIDLVLNFVPQNEFSGEFKRQREFTDLLMGNVTIPPSSSPELFFGSNAIPSEENNWVGENFSAYKNEEMDAATVKAGAALSEAEAKDAWSTIQERFTEDLPMINLFFEPEAVVAVPEMEGARGAAIDGRGHWSNTWDIEK